VNVNSVDKNGATPLYHAVQRGFTEVSYFLNSVGAIADAPAEKAAKFLCLCGYKGELEKVKLFNECEGDIQAADYDLRTVGHLAASEN